MLCAMVFLFVFAVPAMGAEAAALDNGASYSAPQVKDEHYDMNVTLDTKQNQLKETVTIRICNNTERPLKKLCFRNIADSVIRYDKLYEEYKENRSKKSTVQSVHVLGEKTADGKSNETKCKVTYAKDRSVFYADLGKNALEPGETVSVRIRVNTDIPRRDDRFGYHKMKNGKFYSLSFCFPYLAEYRNGKWNTSPYFDDGENRARAVTDYSVRFKAPKSYQVAAYGVQSSKNGVTTIRADQVRDLAIVASNQISKDTFRVAGITISNWYLTDSKYANRYRRLTKEVCKDSVRLFTAKVGAYPYKQLVMTQNFFGFATGGMEYPGLIMISGEDFYAGTDTAREDLYSITEIVSHEIGHQWFYATVGSDEYREAWLDEGLTSYLESVVYRLAKTNSMRLACRMMHIEPDFKGWNEEHREYMKHVYQETEKCYVNRPVNKLPEDEPYGYYEYEGGNQFLGELAHVMGQRAFTSALQEYYQTYTLKEATTSDFLRIVRKHVSSAKKKRVEKIISKYIDRRYL